MSDLISIGRSGVRAYQGALAAVSENVTNADTDGYSRRQVVLREVSAGGSDPYTVSRTTAAFGGVNASAVQRVWDQYKAANAWSAGADAGRADTRAQYLSSVETMLDDGDTGVGTRLTAVFTAASQLATNPADSSGRQTMLAALDGAAGAIRQTGANLAKVADTVKTQADAQVEQANADLQTLARVNTGLRGTLPGTAQRAGLEDQRDALLSSLSGALGVDVQLDGSGAATLRLGDATGTKLLAGDDANPAFLAVAADPDGKLHLTVLDDKGTAVAPVTSGTLAGLIDSSTMIADRRASVDRLARTMVDQFATWQAGGRTAAGVAGVPLLSGTDAASLQLATKLVPPATTPVALEPADIAAASPDGTENGNLLALAGGRDASGVEAQWRGLVTDQSLRVAAAKTEQTAAATQKDGAFAALDEVSGVDLDTEAAELLRYQQAYNASAKILQTARDTLQTILALF